MDKGMSEETGQVEADRKGNGKGPNVSWKDIKCVQNLIERCLQKFMTQAEIIAALQVEANVDPPFTCLVWQKLEEQNPEFFFSYNTRLKMRDQIVAFNYMVEQQAHLIQKVSMGMGGAPAPPHPPPPPPHMAFPPAHHLAVGGRHHPLGLGVGAPGPQNRANSIPGVTVGEHTGSHDSGGGGEGDKQTPGSTPGNPNRKEPVAQVTISEGNTTSAIGDTVTSATSAIGDANTNPTSSTGAKTINSQQAPMEGPTGVDVDSMKRSDRDSRGTIVGVSAGVGIGGEVAGTQTSASMSKLPLAVVSPAPLASTPPRTAPVTTTAPMFVPPPEHAPVAVADSGAAAMAVPAGGRVPYPVVAPALTLTGTVGGDEDPDPIVEPLSGGGVMEGADAVADVAAAAAAAAEGAAAAEEEAAAAAVAAAAAAAGRSVVAAPPLEGGSTQENRVETAGSDSNGNSLGVDVGGGGGDLMIDVLDV